MWPLKRPADAASKDKEAEARLQQAKLLAARSRSTTAALRRELEKNGWTELLQQAMGRSA